MGEGIKFYGGGGGIGSLPIEYEYSGSSQFKTNVVEVDGRNRVQWELRLLSTGTLKVKKNSTPYIDVFLVGGGWRCPRPGWPG